MRFALIKGPSQYGALQLHVDQLAAALGELGHQVRVADMAADDGQTQLNSALAGVDCVFGFSGVGCDLRGDLGSVFDVLDCIYATLYVDHPLHHFGRLQTPIRRHVAFFLDRSHVEFVQASPFGGDFAHLGLLPPGANELADEPELSADAYARRPIPLMFTGTYRGEPPTIWRGWPASPARQLAESVAELMAADARLPILHALRQALHAMGADLTPQLFIDVAPLMRAVQAFAEAYHRDVVLNALGRAGTSIQIWGAGWEPMAARYPTFAYGGVGSFAETLHNLRRARVVLNINNGFVAGGHERVFTAMRAGAAVFSDANPYYANAFEDGRDMATYSWPRLAEMPGQLAELLGDVPRAAAIARAGAERVRSDHRWIHRAGVLAAAVARLAS